jgi:hypothetical protein
MSSAATPELARFAAARRSSLIGTVISIAVIGVALGASAVQLRSMRKEVAALDATKQRLQTEIDARQRQLEAVKRRSAEIQTALLPAEGPPEKDRIERSLRTAAVSVLPRIYIHIANESQRPVAQKAVEALREQAYLVPGIENVGSKAPARTQLKYFTKDDEAECTKILQVIRNVGIAVEPSYQPQYAEGLRPHHFELWFGEQ